MRSMLVRAAEIRDSEQQQIFDALDEIHARLAPLESLGSVRKRLSEMPDRTEVSVLAARLDQALVKLEAQDSAISALSHAVESIADKLAKPFAELGGRLDGVAGRFEGVAGRMDGLEDRIAGLHKRIDDMDHHLDRQDAKVDALPAAVHGPVREQIGATETGFRSRLDEVDKTVQESLAGAVESLTQRLDALSNRLNGIEEGVVGRIGSITERLGALDGALAHRPDVDSLIGLIRKANEESELRYTAQLDEAMATFAEIIMGGSPPAGLSASPPPPPRPAQRRTRGRQAKSAEEGGDAAEGVAS
ncbi:MAG TPA: PA containing protein [Pseudonocardiaceae bacterium]|nr:PA containing protein [Pseudonocardiaceae bacterium]